jgi:catechol 2,3-dioxygenase-like lactoylglutathione lyase family enzyme
MPTLPIDSQITFVYTRDLKTSAHFYEDVLGLSLAVDQGSCRIYHIAGRKAYFGICERDTAPEDPVGLIFTFVTQDVDGWYERITAHGWQCDGAPRMNTTYHIYHFFVKDPNGYLLEVQRFAEVDWDKSDSN